MKGKATVFFLATCVAIILVRELAGPSAEQLIEKVVPIFKNTNPIGTWKSYENTVGLQD